MSTLKAKRRKRWAQVKESAVKAFFFTNGILAIFILLGIFWLLLSSSFPFFREVRLQDFLASAHWDPTSPL